MKVHSLLIGINYENSTYPLQYAVRDAEQLYRMAKSSYDGLTKLLVNQAATAQNIRAELAALYEMAQADPQCTVVVHFSGHGTKQPEPCLVTYGWQRNVVTENTCLTLKEIRDWLSRFRTHVVFFIDACYAGGIAGLRSLGGITLRSIPTLPGTATADETAHSYFTSLNSDKVIITASDEDEAAIESADLGHGIFTQCLIEALSGAIPEDSHGLVSVTEVGRYVGQRVALQAQSIGAACGQEIKQHPITHSTMRDDIRLPVLVQAPPRSLVNFPQAFAPLTIVVGDRREADPRTPGDFLARSASTADLRWILSLNLPSDVEIISDKIFVNSTPAHLTEQYGDRNLLVIGSPMANHVSRLINESAFFWFAIERAPRREARRMMDEIKAIAHDRLALSTFAEDKLKRKKERFLINMQKGNGFIDLTYDDNLRRGIIRDGQTDYGVVTLAKHPFAGETDKIAIYAAGVGLPATMQSIKLLADPKTYFVRHPFGGIFKVNILQAQWSERMANAQTEWSTENYTLAGLAQRLQAISGDPEILDDLSVKADSINARLEMLNALEAEGD